MSEIIDATKDREYKPEIIEKAVAGKDSKIKALQDQLDKTSRELTDALTQNDVFKARAVKAEKDRADERSKNEKLTNENEKLTNENKKIIGYNQNWSQAYKKLEEKYRKTEAENKELKAEKVKVLHWGWYVAYAICMIACVVVNGLILFGIEVPGWVCWLMFLVDIAVLLLHLYIVENADDFEFALPWLEKSLSVCVYVLNILILFCGHNMVDYFGTEDGFYICMVVFSIVTNCINLPGLWCINKLEDINVNRVCLGILAVLQVAVFVVSILMTIIMLGISIYLY